MILVPFDCIDSEVVTIVRLQVLPTVGLGAEMDLALFGTYEEDVILELIEIEAHATGKSIKERFFFIIAHVFALINYKFELDNFLCL